MNHHSTTVQIVLKDGQPVEQRTKKKVIIDKGLRALLSCRGSITLFKNKVIYQS
jgi:hypothetical protein